MYNLIVISALIVLILNNAFGKAIKAKLSRWVIIFVDYSLALLPLGTTLIILHFRTLKEKG